MEPTVSKEPQVKDFADISGLAPNADNSADELSGFTTIKGNADWPVARNGNASPLPGPANSSGFNPLPPSSRPRLTIKRLIIGASITIIFFAAFNSFRQAYKPRPNAAAPNIAHQNNAPNFELQYDIPPVDTNHTFTIDQIRWILREDIRIEAMRNIVNPRNASAVDKFNNMVNNYNARVSEFRYIVQDMEHAQREIEAIRSQIVWEAINEARGWNAIGQTRR